MGLSLKVLIRLRIMTELGLKVCSAGLPLATHLLDPTLLAAFVRGIHEAFDRNADNTDLEILIHSYFDVQVWTVSSLYPHRLPLCSTMPYSSWLQMEARILQLGMGLRGLLRLGDRWWVFMLFSFLVGS